MKGGYLRHGVRVVWSSDVVSISHGFWATDLPAAWVAATPVMQRFLDRRLSVEDLGAADRSVQAVVTLLEAQGCLSFADDQDTYSLIQVRELFEQLSAAWYGRYYAHPVWDRLRDGSLSPNAMVSWLLYTYHLSRSAGMSAARSATFLRRPGLRGVFARSALEEYSHCEDFFFVRHPNLRVTDRQVHEAVQLPSCVAFDQQMLRMAEDDWLGHVLAALFQENTAAFHRPATEFHALVSRNYRLGDYFSHWERHVLLDLGESHADQFSALLNSAEQVPRSSLVYSLHDAWITYQFLLGALDDIMASDRDDDLLCLRLPFDHAALNIDKNPLTAPYLDSQEKWAAFAEAGTPARCWTQLDHLRLPMLPITLRSSCWGSLRPVDHEFLQVDVARTITRAMSFARGHHEVLLFGRLATEALEAVGHLSPEPFEDQRQPRSHHTMALANFLRELSASPIEFAFALHHAVSLTTVDTAEVVGSWLPVGRDAAAAIREFLRGTQPARAQFDRMVTLALQLNELYLRWASRSAHAEPVDFFQG